MRRERVVVYVTRGDQLLVFDHRDHPEAGTQVPAGGVHEEEALDDAAIREVFEETGVVLDGRPTFLGTHEHVDGLGRPARSSFVQIAAPSTMPDSWQHQVTGSGDDQRLVFLCGFDSNPRLQDVQSLFWLKRL